MRNSLLTLLILSTLVAQAAKVNFMGINLQSTMVEAPTSTGLEAVYVLSATRSVKAQVTVQSASSTVTCSRFSNLGGAYAEPIDFERNGKSVEFTLSNGDMGYMVEEAGRNTCFWVVDYSKHTFTLSGLTVSDESDCSVAILKAIGSGDRITYYSINGRGETLSRDIVVEYSSLAYDAETQAYRAEEVEHSLACLEEVMPVTAPLCDTRFKMRGDRFLRQWGKEIEAESAVYQAVAVEANTSAEQAERTSENEISESVSGLGGSAPCEVTFKAVTTDAAVYTEWLISREPDFNSLENSFRDLEFTYTFTENGTTYVRFQAADNSGDCMFTGPTYEVFIGESKLLCPNAFSPGASEGVNDEWRVSYKSIISYDCHIFNRWGHEVFSSTDPSAGWNGKVGNKTVPAGVYYYVIKAKGADGVDYNLSGDINIVGFKAGTMTPGGDSSAAGSSE